MDHISEEDHEKYKRAVAGVARPAKSAKPITADDPSIIGGLARFGGQSVMVIGHQKGRDTKEKLPNRELQQRKYWDVLLRSCLSRSEMQHF